MLVSVFGKEFTVSPRELTLLRLFTARPGSIVALEELIGLLWKDSPLLHEHELERLVRELSRKTADHLVGSIETFSGIGYRFMLPQLI
ncbi:MAG: helix-turn-helix domain-containing protein [Nitrospira sp.]|nr:helix-turn-helix domain-containing protein [Nitrospira sp.]